MSKRGVAVDHTSNHFSEGDSTSLSFARGVAEPVHQRHVGVVKQVGGELDVGGPLLGGELEIESSPGGGTSLYVRLPDTAQGPQLFRD